MPEPTETGSLDLAIDWLQRNLDDLTAATRRTQRLSAGGPLVPPADAVPAASAASSIAGASPTSAGSPSAVSPSLAVSPSSASSAPPAAVPATPPPVASTTPLLDKLGRDLTKLAAEGSLTPLIGRTQEMDWLIEVLVRTTKRNPVLLGPAGAGKTAIVEGLAQRIAAGKVPALLQGTRLIEVPLGGLVAGTQYRGQLEERLAQLVKEASQPGIILFFDEIHLLEGAGKSEGGMGADEVLKPRPGAWRHRGHRRHDARGLPPDHRAGFRARTSFHDDRYSGARQNRDAADPAGLSRPHRHIARRPRHGRGARRAARLRRQRPSSTAASRTRRSTCSSRPWPGPSWPAERRSIATMPSRRPQL